MAIENHEVDILIIGGGPAGLTAVLYAARAMRKRWSSIRMES